MGPMRESALKVDSGRKLPCCTRESNLRQWRASPMIYQLSYSPPSSHLLHSALQDLLTYSLEDLIALWDEVQQFSPQRQEWIAQLDSKLKALEDERMRRVGDLCV